MPSDRFEDLQIIKCERDRFEKICERKSDSDPGIQTLWRGFQRLNDIAGIWQLLYQGDF